MAEPTASALHPDTEQGLTLLLGTDALGAPVVRDTTRGRRLLERAHADEDAYAARWLGILAERQGDGETARVLYQTAARRGDPMAFEWEMLLHQQGRPPFPVDFVAAAQVVAREARRGNARAQVALSQLLADNAEAARRGEESALALRDTLDARGLTRL